MKIAMRLHLTGMLIMRPDRSISTRTVAFWIAVGLWTWGSSIPLFAALGDTSVTVQADREKIAASLTVVEAGSFTVHEMKSPNGTTVREYVSRSHGLVFAVTWRGPFVPDMKQLLGNYFSQYRQAVRAQHENQVGIRPLRISSPRLVVETAGHMRAFSGRAYDPALMPSGVSVDDIR